MYYKFTYKTAPEFTVMETILKKMYEIIGWRDMEADVIFSPAKKKQEISTY